MHIYIRSGNRPIIIKANVITENPPAVASIQHATIIRLERTLQTEKAMAARITNITPIPKNSILCVEQCLGDCLPHGSLRRLFRIVHIILKRTRPVFGFMVLNKLEIFY